ncbi:hypothetical protein CRG98_006723 [Punica granatum]|uniref:Uncharacterized protein n=1 Tax=Punica granatum TaxID=22663 RepID=A0A2I0KWK4_PUNGR|nr:hypothetical protein CRG98_006723 [Punica granatum]
MSVFHTRHPMGRALDERDTPFTGESDARGHVPPRTPLTPTSLYFDREGARRGDNGGKAYVKFAREKRRSILLLNAQDMFQNLDPTDETGARTY